MSENNETFTNRMATNNPFEPWNSPIKSDDPFAPWNDPIKRDNQFAAWNNSFGHGEYEDEARSY